MTAGKFLAIVGGICRLSFFLPVVYAAETPTFSGLPSIISWQDEVEIDENFAGDPQYYKNKTYYLRGVFYQTDSKYCSYTQNNSGEWINSGSQPERLFAFTTNQEGSWSGKLKVKYDRESSNCEGSGQYYFKVGRYTSSATWSETQTIQINVPSPSPVPTPTPTPSPTPKPTPLPTTPRPTSTPRTTNPPSPPHPTATSTGYSSATGAVQGVLDETDALVASSSGELELALISSTAAQIASASIQIPARSSAIENSPKKSNKNVVFVWSGFGLTTATVVSFLVKRYNNGLSWPFKH